MMHSGTLLRTPLNGLTQFLEGTRDFESAITIEEYVVEVDAFPDGTIVDECVKTMKTDEKDGQDT